MRSDKALSTRKPVLQPVSHEDLRQIEGGVLGIAVGLGVLVGAMYVSRYIGPMEHRILAGIKAPKT